MNHPYEQSDDQYTTIERKALYLQSLSEGKNA